MNVAYDDNETTVRLAPEDTDVVSSALWTLIEDGALSDDPRVVHASDVLRNLATELARARSGQAFEVEGEG